MKRLGIFTALAMLLMAVSASVAFAVINPANAPQGTHLQSGAIGCSVGEDLSVTCTSFELAGVGNTNAAVSLVANYSAIVDCFNPGANRNNPIESHTTSFSAADTFTAASTKNGRLTVRAATASPQTGLSSQSCPNPNWTPQIRPGSLQLVSFTYTVTFAGFNAPYISITGP